MLPLQAQVRFLPFGDSITAGAAGGPSGQGTQRGGYRYYLERFLEGSEGGAGAFQFTGSVTGSPGTIAAWAGQYNGLNAKPLNHPLHSGYPGYSIEQVTALVVDDTVPVATSDVVLLQIGTNNIGTSTAEPVPATPADITSWTTAYRALLDALLAKNPTVKVVMAKIPPLTTGAGLGNIAANAARIEPFNGQVVEPLYQEYAALHPGRFFLVDNYSPLDPLNVATSWAAATNDTDFLTVGGDGVHPYNAGHRKMAVGFWKAGQFAMGKAAADLITVHDGGEDACIREAGTAPDGGLLIDWDDVARQPFVRSGGSPGERAKYYIKLDLTGKPKDWQDARFNLVFWGGPSGNPDFGNCVNDAPSQATLKLYGLPDGGDDWSEQGITWANAPRNDTGGHGVVDGVFLGDLVVPAGAKSGDIISVASPALRDFVNHQRGLDGKVTFVVTGDGTDAGYFATFQDADFRDYLSAFLQMTRNTPVPSVPGLQVLNHAFDLAAQPRPRVNVTFASESGRSYLLSGSADLQAFDAVLAADIEGQTGQTTIEADLPEGAADRFFIRIEAQ